MDPYLKVLRYMKKHDPKYKLPARAADVPVNQRMLYGVRDELKSDIKSLEARMDSRFAAMDSRFSQSDSRFASIEARLSQIESHVHQIKILVEEQNAKNNFVLDGLASPFHRQDRVEDRQTRLEKRLLK